MGYSAWHIANTRAANRNHENRIATRFGSDRQRPQLGLLSGSALHTKRANSAEAPSTM
jgi:hypothetical protein